MKLKLALFMCVLLCGGCSSIKWNGFYTGAQNVTPLLNYRPDEHSTSIYGNAIWNIGKNWSFQLEPIVPIMNPDEPLLRIAVDRKLF